MASVTSTVASEPDGSRALRITIDGEFDLANCHLLLEAALQALSLPKVDSVVVDLEGTTFLEARTVSMLVRARRALEETGRGLRVVGAHGVVATVLRLTGVTPLLVDLTIDASNEAGSAR
jgi:anti-anti-sigma factor